MGLIYGYRVVCDPQRPYARATPGIPRLSRYDMYTLEYEYAFDAYTHEGTQKGGGTFTGRAEVQVVEFYLPQRRYGKAFEAGHVEVRVDEGTWEWREKVGLVIARSISELPVWMLKIPVVCAVASADYQNSLVSRLAHSAPFFRRRTNSCYGHYHQQYFPAKDTPYTSACQTKNTTNLDPQT